MCVCVRARARTEAQICECVNAFVIMFDFFLSFFNSAKPNDCVLSLGPFNLDMLNPLLEKFSSSGLNGRIT